MKTGGKLLAGAAWIYGAQLATVLAQLFYAAITSRLVDEGGFGAYTVALAAGALASLLATGGVGQAVARMQCLEPRIVSALWFFGLIIGVLTGASLWIGAPLWATIWSSPDALIPTKIMALGTIVAPASGLAASLLRRQGRYRFLSLSTLACNLVGMVVGAWATFIYESAASLIVAVVFSQWLVCIVTLLVNIKFVSRKPSFTGAWTDIGFSGKLTIIRLYTYCNLNLGPWSVSAFLSPALLGQWNRADVVSTVPMQQVQTAITQVIYPEFRHDRDSKRRSSMMWPDLFALVGWVALVLSISVAFFVPILMPSLFGDGWSEAARMVPFLAAAGGLTLVAAVVSAAVESLGHFKWIWGAQLIQSLCIVPGVWVGISTRSIQPILIASIVVSAAKLFWYLGLLMRVGTIDSAHTRRRAFRLLVGFLIAWISFFVVENLIRGWLSGVMWAGWLLIPLLIGAIFIILRTWHSWDPVTIAHRYGLFPRWKLP